MSYESSVKIKTNKNSKVKHKEEIYQDIQENNIRIIRRTLENNTHIVIEDSKLKNVTSWRKSQTKFMKNLIFNILSLGILHIVSKYYPKLYLKLYCNPRPAKECDFFLVENIYGQFTLCEKIHKKNKPNDSTIYDSDNCKGNIIPSTLIHYKIESYLTKNVTYSFKYKSVVYEYNEETNEIIPVYMDLSKLTNKSIFNYFNDGLSTQNLVNKFEQRYGNNEYHLNLGLSFFYFKKIESVYLIFILLIQALNLYFHDLISFLFILGIILLLFLAELIIAKQIIFNIYKKEYTLDGEENKIKVKRKYKLVDNDDTFYEINNYNLLPGDIVYLKPNDFAPCDCLILEGECIVSKYQLTGSLDTEKKKSLESNNEQFDYQLNKISTLYHGMKIEKTISKSNEGYITVLCINTGSNTYKANQYSNILYLLERNLEYRKSYEILGEGRTEVLFMIISILLFTVIFGAVYFFSLKVNLDFGNHTIRKLFYEISIRIIGKTFMPVYFITNSLIYLIGLFHLKNENISCFEKSKIKSPSRINTIFFSKTGILCETKFEINAYHPFYRNSYKSNIVSYRTYKFNQSKEMNSQLLKYYKHYLKRNDPFSKDFNLRQALTMNTNKKFYHDKMGKEAYEYTTIFLECLLSCNNIEKYNTEIFGNSIETIIFQNLNWDMKSYRFNKNLDDKSKDINDSNNTSNLNQTNSENKKFEYDGKSNLIDNNINDIYPNNYYKITESMNNEDEYESKPLITRLNSNFYQSKQNSNNTSEFSITQNNINIIKNNISKSHIISYKLRIYKRFIKNGTLNSSAIVYNFITKELRFMTKGIPEEVLEKCERSTLPDNFENIISLYRRRGFIIIVCAFKIIDVDEYKDSNTLEDYMCNLTFCGFITLKNRLKKEIFNSIHELRQFNCNLIISSGDNIFNCLPIGFESSIVDNKNIFSFDKDDKKNNIIISKICCIKKERDYEIDESDKKTITTINEKVSKQNFNKTSLTPITKPKKGLMLKYLRKNNGDDISDKDNDKKELYFENKKFGEIKRKRGKTIHQKYKASIFQEYTKVSDKELKVSSNNSNLSPLNASRNKNQISSREYQNEKTNTNTNRKLINNTSEIKVNKSLNTSNFEKYYFYPEIFEENEDLSNNSIYCISGKAFSFLYKNKHKKHCQKILDKIYQKCKIFYNMSSLDKSLAVDFFREYPNNCVCTIGKYQSDYDAILSSNVGISLNAPKNVNTILCHFYSSDSSILSIKKLINEGRTINENILLLKITCFFYTIILNSYILCCFMMEIEVINGQLNFLEICFLILSVTAFTIQYDIFKKSNPLIQSKILYILHYTWQIFGIFIIKLGSIFMLRQSFIDNSQLENTLVYKIFITYYFILCLEHCFSTFFVFNYISFYRKHPLTNASFIIFNLLLFIYLIFLISLNSSNFRVDFFNITIFEFNEDLIDSFDDNNRLKCFRVCIFDFLCSFIYSRIIYYIFDFLANKSYKLCK